MKNRLNVTQAERLCYSRRRLQAISALRNVGIDPTIPGLHKEHRVPGIPGKVYLVQHPNGIAYAFPTLAEIHRYAAECQAWRTQPRFSWDTWRQGPPKPTSHRVSCSWPDCQYDADGVMDNQPYCQAHGFIYEQMLLANGKRAS